MVPARSSRGHSAPLGRHTVWDDRYPPACKGCGSCVCYFFAKVVAHRFTFPEIINSRLQLLHFSQYFPDATVTLNRTHHAV